MIFSDLASPAEAGFAKAGNRFPTSPDHALWRREFATWRKAAAIRLNAGHG